MKSAVWGNEDFPISQGFGVNLPTIDDSWYAYAADWGLNYGDHAGLDVAVPKGTPIHALTGGKVIQAGWSPWFRPNPVTIETIDDPDKPGDDREEHIYGHLWEAVVKVGDIVKAGDLLGYSGEQTISGTMTPDGSGPHLHFERRILSTTTAADPSGILTGGFIGGEPVTGLPNTGDGGGISGAVNRAIAGAAQLAARAGLAIVGIALLVLGLVAIVGPGRIVSALPIGRAAKLAGKAGKAVAA